MKNLSFIAHWMTKIWLSREIHSKPALPLLGLRQAYRQQETKELGLDNYGMGSSDLDGQLNTYSQRQAQLDGYISIYWMYFN